VSALVTLDRLFINPAADPSEVLAVPFWRGSTRTRNAAGEVRVNAGGRTRLVRRVGAGAVWVPDIGHVPFDVALRLEELAERLLCFRDPLGGRVWGTYFTPTITTVGLILGVQHATVALNVATVTRFEGV
jgi:hypothetical protein